MRNNKFTIFVARISVYKVVFGDLGIIYGRVCILPPCGGGVQVGCDGVDLYLSMGVPSYHFVGVGV